MSESSKATNRQKSYVIGEQFAAATRAEHRRLQLGDYGQSPMPEATYDRWRGELSLVRLARLTLDTEIATVCRVFRLADSAGRNTFRRAISMDELYTLLTFSRRSAVFALREQMVEEVADGLTAVAMVDAERVDFRDILVALSLLHHAATRIGEDAQRLFREAAELSQPDTARLVTEFASRRPQDQHLRDAWGYDEVWTDGGIGLVRWGFKPYDPTADFGAIALEIVGMLDADEYEPDDPQLATDLPAVWLRGIGDPRLAEALRAIRAGATINGRLRPAASPTHTSQQLTIFVVELGDAAQVASLLEMSEKASHGFVSLGVAEDRLFCLVVGRSYVQGVESYETRGSVARFGPELARILRRHAVV